MDIRAFGERWGVYPWAKVFFGFVGGMFLLHYFSVFLHSPTVIFYAHIHTYVQRGVYFASTWSIWICNIILALFFVLCRLERNHKGVVQATLCTFVFSIVIKAFEIFVSNGLQGEYANMVLVDAIQFIIEQTAFAMILAWLLFPESVAAEQDTDDDDDDDDYEGNHEIPPYPYLRVILLFALASGPLTTFVIWLILLSNGIFEFSWSLYRNDWFYYPGTAYGVWFCCWRLHRNFAGIIHALAVTIPFILLAVGGFVENIDGMGYAGYVIGPIIWIALSVIVILIIMVISCLAFPRSLSRSMSQDVFIAIICGAMFAAIYVPIIIYAFFHIPWLSHIMSWMTYIIRRY